MGTSQSGFGAGQTNGALTMGGFAPGSTSVATSGKPFPRKYANKNLNRPTQQVYLTIRLLPTGNQGGGGGGNFGGSNGQSSGSNQWSYGGSSGSGQMGGAYTNYGQQSGNLANPSVVPSQGPAYQPASGGYRSLSVQRPNTKNTPNVFVPMQPDFQVSPSELQSNVVDDEEQTDDGTDAQQPLNFAHSSQQPQSFVNNNQTNFRKVL